MYITIDNNPYEVVVEHKKIRHTYIRVKEDMKIYVSTSKWTSSDDIKRVLEQEIDNIKKMINRQEKRLDDSHLILGREVDVVSISNLKEPELENGKFYIKDRSKLDLYYKDLAFTIFKQRLEEIYKLFEEKIPYPTLKIRKMRSRWGVCNRRNNSITLNLELLKKDIKYIDYVIVHELSHFIYFNHSSSFWKIVEKYTPNYKIIRRELRE